MAMDDLKIETRDRVCTITLTRPQAKNALTIAMYAALTDAVRAADADPAVDVLRIEGAGGDFSSGNDLRDFLENAPVGPESTVFQFMHAMADVKKPIVAKVEGFAVGIGSTMLLHADLVYASDTAKFVLPFVNLGLVPEAGSSYVLSRLLGHRRASEIFMFGAPFDAQTALEAGLVSKVVPAAELDATVDKRVQRLLSLSPEAILTTKALLKSHQQVPLLAHLDAEANEFCRLLRTPPVEEAISAFFEKRKPDFAQFREG